MGAEKIDASNGEFSDVSDHDGESNQPPLQRKLKNRHIAMISIGGVIGTGLFVGTADSLMYGGPIGLLLGYMVMGTIVYCVMITLGEMVAFLPIPGGHIKLAERFVDPAFSFAMGWNYCYSWMITSEISAAALLINYWNHTVNNSVWVVMCLVVVLTINMLGAGAYGEAEFIFASIKVITITVLIILGIVIDLGGGPNHDRIGFRYWKNPGPFVQYNGIEGAKGRFLGWCAVLTQAAFSFIGTEIVAIAAGEAKNPRRNLPKAIRRVYIRILVFYIGGTLVIGLLVPSNNPLLKLSSNTARSPFVIAVEMAGIKYLPSVSRTCLSFFTSKFLIATQTRFQLIEINVLVDGLAASRNAPKFFLKTTRNGLPYVAVLFCASFSLLAFMAVSTSAGSVFIWFSNMTAVAGLLTWFGISVTYVRFYKGMQVQGIDRKTLPYYTNLQPYAAWWGVVSTITICFVFTNYFPLIAWPILYVGARFYYGTKPVAAEDMDFKSDLAEIVADTYDELPPKNKMEAFWQWLSSLMIVNYITCS
ncbi:amino acid permease/ SLC12A domain-containing protein [Suillus subaureus]|uniref:Amino acid permease/ SLC12A domain-containing protein n=1 Tax=Suillus subaureus TaxID=48587 RepID=A0A9P7J5V1_9AGAM|nr:amino acid permease/ SLC12A domain-containing protein [Suillus subaureus]KAG1803965.1 amino acid permease/ SLC12A domain-containing protein [Suillus subaureus]